MHRISLRILNLILITIFLSFCLGETAYARRVHDFIGPENILGQISRYIQTTSERLERGEITNYVAADEYLSVIELCHRLLKSNLDYRLFVDTLRATKNAADRYYKCAFAGNETIETTEEGQITLWEISLEMLGIIKDRYNSYIRGMASDILRLTILFTDNGLAGEEAKRELRDGLCSVLETGGFENRFFAIRPLGSLIKSLPEQKDRNELIGKLASVLDDSDSILVGRVIQTLGEVLSSTKLDPEFRDEIISKLIGLYTQPIHYPASSYLATCLKTLVGNAPNKWYQKISEALRKYQILNRESILNYIFGNE